jgi:geranylgeranyl pyrophosphate synthase
MNSPVGVEIEIRELEAFLRQELALANSRLHEAMGYSLHSGGKRFRPMVSYLTARAFEISKERVTPFAAAIECVHTYSLIHDDLPAMDDDDLRRGQPTNHKVYGEALAILAGDALLTEAFRILADHYKSDPSVGLELTRILAQAAGAQGMVRGQALDMTATEWTADQLLEVHALKTGALIACAVEGVAILAQTSGEERRALAGFGRDLGLAFQLTDDILDYVPGSAEASGLPKCVGLPATEDLLAVVTSRAKAQLSRWGGRAAGLLELLELNSTRQK